MKFKYLQKTTLLDFPGRIASILFVGGCNFRCGFCYNLNLAQTPGIYPDIEETEVLKKLIERKKYVDSVVITGGEPLLYKEVLPFLQKLRENGFYIKLDTNGYNPLLLDSVIKQKLVDYIAMDLKAPIYKYSEITGIDINENLIKQSIAILKENTVPYEFRTTVWKNAFTGKDYNELLDLAKSSEIYYLQNFYQVNDSTEKNEQDYQPLTKAEIEPVLATAVAKGQKITLRGNWF